MFQTKVVKNIKTHILCSVTFWELCHLWKNVENYYRGSRPQMAIWCKLIACWILKATNTHNQVV